MAMRTYAELSQQAWLCAHYARTSRHNLVAKELWMIAQEYQRGAADKNGGIAPDIGEPPFAQTNVAWSARQNEKGELASLPAPFGSAKIDRRVRPNAIGR
jgi:hypothetical protein